MTVGSLELFSCLEPLEVFGGERSLGAPPDASCQVTKERTGDSIITH